MQKVKKITKHIDGYRSIIYNKIKKRIKLKLKYIEKNFTDFKIAPSLYWINNKKEKTYQFLNLMMKKTVR